MVRVNNLVESHDNTAVKGNENQSKSEKFGNIAVDSWKEMEQNYKDSASKNSKNNSDKNSFDNDGGSKNFGGKDGSIKDGGLKDGGTKNDKFSLTFDDPYKSSKNEKNDNSSGIQEKKMMSDEDMIIQKKKEAALDDANIIQKKKELADSGKPGATVEGKLEFSPDKPKVPADGGLKDLTFDNDFYLQKL
ncbi:MAG: hypothetical protein WCT03_04670 [Candidatus Obscuribacterales bacterium]|jgi:hypothetical protein